MKKGTILVVEDNKNVLSALKILLENYFKQVILLASPNTLIHTMQDKKPDIVLLDMNFSAGINSGNEGLYWLSEIKKQDQEVPVVLFTAYADIELAVEGLKKGAADFIVKPWENAKLIATLQTSLELGYSKKEVKKLRERQKSLNINNEEKVCWGKSAVMQDLLKTINKVADTDANVLITGENGTGKELIAREIHALSSRADEIMVTVDLGAVTETLFESELFGHIKGAFTDAKQDRAGKFEAADKGSLFLDEIGNLSYSLQSKLLTALQSRKVTRVGSNKSVPVDIRLIAATNKDLFKAVDAGEFREDLLYRINTIHIEVPPLRDRKEDIPLLVSYFLDKYSRKYNKEGLRLSREALNKLDKYNWPGNVRELQHAVEKAVILSENELLKESDFHTRLMGDITSFSDFLSLEEMEIKMIKKALEKHDHNISLVADILGITRPTLYNKMKKYGIS